MYDFHQAYLDAINIPSDINEHLPTLDRLAKDCKHITEFGVRFAISTAAWLNNDVELISYDITATHSAAQMFDHAYAANRPAKYIIQDVLSLEDIAETDLLFIDTLHNYEQCKNELKFATRVKKYIVFHDTVTFGVSGETATHGVLPAIAEFLLENKDWTVKEHYTNNNGLTVLWKTN